MVKGSAFDGSGGSFGVDDVGDLAVRKAFARRLLEIRRAKGWNQSDMHRASGLTRNQISRYMNAKALPSDASLTKLARALRMEPEELLPERKFVSDDPAVSMALSADGKRMRLTVDVWVPAPIGAQIIQMLTGNATAHGE